MWKEGSTGLVVIGITVYQTGDLNWLGESQGLRQNILRNPAPVQWGLIFAAYKVKSISFSHCSPSFFFFSFIPVHFASSWTPTDQAVSGFSKWHLPGKLCSSFCCTVLFQGLASPSPTAWAPAGPAHAQIAFSGDFFGQLSSHKKAIFNSSLKGTGKK